MKLSIMPYLCATIACLVIFGPDAVADKRNSKVSLSAANLASVQSLIKPQKGEGLWRHVPWETSLTTARQKAAAEGKPLLIWAGGGSAPLGGC